MGISEDFGLEWLKALQTVKTKGSGDSGFYAIKNWCLYEFQYVQKETETVYLFGWMSVPLSILVDSSWMYV